MRRSSAHVQIDLKEPRPKTRGEALSLISETFEANKWRDHEQQVYLAQVGLKGDWRGFENDKLKIILDDMERYKMVLFREAK